MTIFFKKTVTLTHSAEIFLDTILHKTVYFTLVNLMIAIGYLMKPGLKLYSKWMLLSVLSLPM